MRSPLLLTRGGLRGSKHDHVPNTGRHISFLYRPTLKQVGRLVLSWLTLAIIYLENSMVLCWVVLLSHKVAHSCHRLIQKASLRSAPSPVA